MTIGEKIKDLRKKNDLTQEKLADFLNVSYQAVSKWECGLSNPDLSLIGPLTKLLHVSADELLGLTNDSIDTRCAELERKYNETLKTGDMDARYNVACDAVRKFPGEMKYLDWLAWCEAMRSFNFEDEEEYIAKQEKAIKLFACVIENATDEKIKASSIQGIVQYLCFRGRYEEAKKYAKLYPENLSVSKDQVLLECMQGKEKTIYQQKMLNRMIIDLLNHIGIDNMDACLAQEKIIKTFILDENYLHYHSFLSENYKMRAKWFMLDGKVEKAIETLKISLKHAIAYDKFLNENTKYHFSSPFFNQVEFNTNDICKSGTTTLTEDFYEFIHHPLFDSIREREDFKSIK